MYQYKCVPAPKELVVKKQSDMDKAVEDFAKIINSNSTDGWEFYSMEQISCTVPAGCLSGLFGKKEQTVYYNMLVFRREF